MLRGIFLFFASAALSFALTEAFPTPNAEGGVATPSYSANFEKMILDGQAQSRRNVSEQVQNLAKLVLKEYMNMLEHALNKDITAQQKENLQRLYDKFEKLKEKIEASENHEVYSGECVALLNEINGESPISEILEQNGFEEVKQNIKLLLKNFIAKIASASTQFLTSLNPREQADALAIFGAYHNSDAGKAEWLKWNDSHELILYLGNTYVRSPNLPPIKVTNEQTYDIVRENDIRFLNSIPKDNKLLPNS